MERPLAAAASGSGRRAPPERKTATRCELVRNILHPTYFGYLNHATPLAAMESGDTARPLAHVGLPFPPTLPGWAAGGEGDNGGAPERGPQGVTTAGQMVASTQRPPPHRRTTPPRRIHGNGYVTWGTSLEEETRVFHPYDQHRRTRRRGKLGHCRRPPYGRERRGPIAPDPPSPRRRKAARRDKPLGGAVDTTCLTWMPVTYVHGLKPPSSLRLLSRAGANDPLPVKRVLPISTHTDPSTPSVGRPGREEVRRHPCRGRRRTAAWVSTPPLQQEQ